MKIARNKFAGGTFLRGGGSTLGKSKAPNAEQMTETSYLDVSRRVHDMRTRFIQSGEFVCIFLKIVLDGNPEKISAAGPISCPVLSADFNLLVERGEIRHPVHRKHFRGQPHQAKTP